MRALVVYESMYGNTRVAAAPGSFAVGSDTTLLDGEAAQAHWWGGALGIIATDSYAPAGS